MGSLVEICLNMRTPRTVNLSAGGGQRLNALFLGLVKEADEAVSARLHDMRPPKPYTVSPLYGEMESVGEGRLRLFPDRAYELRLTLLDDELARLWSESIQPSMIGRYVILGDIPLFVEGLRVRATDADDLYRECVVSRKPPPRRLTLKFLSPTAFRSGGRNVLFPLPRLIWQSANRAWSAVSRVDLGADIHRMAEEVAHPSRFSLFTHILHFDRSRQIGVVGVCEYLLRQDDEDLCRALHLLARFSEFCGLGMKTTMGMGQVRFRSKYAREEGNPTPSIS